MRSTDKNNQRPRAIVIGLDCMTGLQTARILARRGVPVVGIASDPKHPCSRTRVCERILFVDTGGPELIRTLEKLGPRMKQKPVLFCCTDLSVWLTARHRDQLEHWYHVPLPDPDVVEMLMDKSSSHSYAQKQGLLVPTTRLLRGRADAEQAARELTFPCVLKPAMKTRAWEEQKGPKVGRASNPEEFLASYDQCSKWADLLLAQEWIEGSDDALYSCNCYFNADSKLIAAFVARKLRQWPPEAGTSCLGEECRNDVVLEETLRLFGGVRYRGLGYVEMKRDERTGKHFFIEANVGRPTGRSAIAEAGGVELLYAMYCDAVGYPLPANLNQTYQGVKWIHLRRDLQSALYYWRRGQLTLSQWWRSWRGRKAYALFSWTDPRPFLADLQRAAGLLLSSGKGNQPGGAERVRTLLTSRRPTGNSPGTKANGTPARVCKQIDYDIHGLVGIRLISPSASDAAAVAGQLGPLQSPLSREPDIVVRFVKQLPTPNLRYLGPKTHGFTDDGYFILRSHKQEARVKVAFEEIGKQCEIVCETGLRSVPLLMAILNLTALKKDCVALHASAFNCKGTGVLVTGWAKGGKTEALLAFALHGAEYVGDEWILLSGDGQNMYGVPEDIRLWDWHLKYLPRVRRQVAAEERLLFKGIQWLDRMQQAIPNGRISKTFPVRTVREAMPALRRQLNVCVAPQTIFGGGFGSLTGRPEKLFLMVSHQDSSIAIEPGDPLSIARRMMSSIRYEQLPLMEHYLAFKYAFPGKDNDFIDTAHQRQMDILCRALAGKEAYTVRHPHPVSLHDLYASMRPFVEQGALRAASSGEGVFDGSLAGSEPHRRSENA